MTGWRQFILRAQMTLDRLAWGLCVDFGLHLK